MSDDPNPAHKELREPLEPSRGTGFVPLKLICAGNASVYRPTGIGQAFPSVFLYLGYATFAGVLFQLGHGLLGALAFLCAGSLFVGIGRYLRSRFSVGAKFDSHGRCVTIPARPPFWPLFETERNERVVSFDQVAEIEIIEKDIFSGDVSDSINYELNLMLKDGDRLNLVSHPNDKLITSEAAVLSRTIGVPVFIFAHGEAGPASSTRRKKGTWI